MLLQMSEIEDSAGNQWQAHLRESCGAHEGLLLEVHASRSHLGGHDSDAQCQPQSKQGQVSTCEIMKEKMIFFQKITIGGFSPFCTYSTAKSRGCLHLEMAGIPLTLSNRRQDVIQCAFRDYLHFEHSGKLQSAWSLSPAA